MMTLKLKKRNLTSELIITNIKISQNINPKRNQGLTGKTAWQLFKQNYATMQTGNGKYPLTYEVVYGHAWKGEQRKTEFGIETRIPVSQLLKHKS